MSDVTRPLGVIDAGDPQAADRLLPLVYEELRKQAAAKMAREDSAQTLQPTALVHEAALNSREFSGVPFEASSGGANRTVCRNPGQEQPPEG